MSARRRGTSGPVLALRGLCATIAAALIAALLVGRASGRLDPVDDVFVDVPVAAGLISTDAPIRYHGVNVGRIAEITSGTKLSTVRLAIDKTAIGLIPSSVVVRVVPRTFFGDIYLQLADGRHRDAETTLRAGAVITIDDSEDATSMYDVFRKVVALFAQIKPEKMQTALTALSQGLAHRGKDIGATIDNLSEAADGLTPAAIQFLDATPQFRDVMDALHTATPDIIRTLSNVTDVSNRMVGDPNFGQALDALADLGSVLAPFLADHREQLITIIDGAGAILATTAARQQGLVDTLTEAKTFADAGSRTFSTGKFSITAVATFAGPMPYSATDCPVYGGTRGAQCAASTPIDPDSGAPTRYGTLSPVEPSTPAANMPRPQQLIDPDGQPVAAPSGADPRPVVPPTPAPQPHYPAEVAPSSAIVGGEPETRALTLLQNTVLGTHEDSERPNIATVVMLGPLVRGTKVRVA